MVLYSEIYFFDKHAVKKRMLTKMQFKVIMILFDDKGHAGWELAEILGIEESNLNPKLKDLEKRNIIFQGQPRKSNRPKRPKGYMKSENIKKAIVLPKRDGDYKEFPYFLNKDLSTFGTVMREMITTNKAHDLGFPCRVIRSSNYIRSIRNSFENFNEYMAELSRELNIDYSRAEVIDEIIRKKIPVGKFKKMDLTNFDENEPLIKEMRVEKELHFINFNENKPLLKDGQVSKRSLKDLEIWWLRYNLTMHCSQDPLDIFEVKRILRSEIPKGYIVGDDILAVIEQEENKLSHQ